MAEEKVKIKPEIYEELSRARKRDQEAGKIPEWMTTGSYQMFKSSYEYEADGFLEQITRVAETAAAYAPDFNNLPEDMKQKAITHYGKNWKDLFKNLIWSNDFSLSTPALGNTGTKRGLSVSCSGGVFPDSISGFYKSLGELAMLSKTGHGTSADFSAIRPRGSKISGGGIADGSWPIMKQAVETSNMISQGGLRRGSFAGYLSIEHDDFPEWIHHVKKNVLPGLHVGWNYSKDVIYNRLGDDKELTARHASVLGARLGTGKGYIWKPDHVNEAQPAMYKKHGLTNKASNLCTEITLFADEEHSYSCIISSMQGTRFDVWKNTGGCFFALVFLNCLGKYYLDCIKGMPWMEKIYNYTVKAMSLGLGLLGFHSYLQEKMIALESFQAHMLNMEIFDHMNKETLLASQWVAKEQGEPEWCKGFGVANTHRMAVAPNVSSAVLAGQVSQGIEPWFANIYFQDTSAGEMMRINPVFLRLMQERGKYNNDTIMRVLKNEGSVQQETWLSDEEKAVLKTAYEVNQEVLIRLASSRQRYIDQGQSLNLFISAFEDEKYVAKLHEMVLKDPYIKGAYYLRSSRVARASDGSCVACAS